MSFNAIFPQYLLSQKQFSYSNSFVLGVFVTPQVYYFLQNFSQKFGTFTTGNRERLVWKPFKKFYFIYFLIYIYIKHFIVLQVYQTYCQCLILYAANEEYYQLLMTNDSQPSGLDASSYTIDEIDSIMSEYTLKNNVSR